MELPNSLICKKMTSTNYKNILELVRRVTSDITLDYWEDLKNLNIEKNKKPLTFGVRLKSQWIQMGGIDMIVKKTKLKIFYIVVKACKLYEFLEFVRLNKLQYVEMYVSKTLCTKKWFNHWDFESLKFYPYCRKFEPIYRFDCFPEYDPNVKSFNSIQ